MIRFLARTWWSSASLTTPTTRLYSSPLWLLTCTTTSTILHQVYFNALLCNQRNNEQEVRFDYLIVLFVIEILILDVVGWIIYFKNYYCVIITTTAYCSCLRSEGVRMSFIVVKSVSSFTGDTTSRIAIKPNLTITTITWPALDCPTWATPAISAAVCNV